MTGGARCRNALGWLECACGLESAATDFSVAWDAGIMIAEGSIPVEEWA